MRRFVIIGQTASASGEFSLEDLPSSSGRLDALLRCLRAALLLSHGVRRDVSVTLVLRGVLATPRLLRVNGASAKFLRPDERSLALLVKKTLSAAPESLPHFQELRPGIELRDGDLPDVLSETAGAKLYLLDEAGADVREQTLPTDDGWFFLGDHTGLDVVSRALLERHGAVSLCVGPLSLHTEDVITLLHGELDRRFFVPAPA